MVKLKTVFLLFLLSQISLTAQRNADWEVDVQGTIQSVIFQNLTGIPIVQTTEMYVGIDPQNKKINWTFDRSGMKKASGVIEVSSDFFEVNLTPYVLISNNLIDSRDGKIILDKEKEGYKKVYDYEIMPDLGGVLLRTSADGQLRLYLVDLKSNAKKWQADVMKTSGLGQALASASSATDEEGATPDISVPMGTTKVTKNGYLIYTYKKHIAVLGANSGKLAWTEKTEPARVMVSPDESVIVSVEAEGGGLMSAGSGAAKMMSKKISAFDLQSGKELWEVELDENLYHYQLWENTIILADKKSCNIYNYKDGKKVWKKDYDQKRIHKVEKNAEGYMVHSGRVFMQLNAEGKAQWKKPNVKPVDPSMKVGEEDNFDGYAYESGEVVVVPAGVSFSPATGSDKKSWTFRAGENARMAFDDARKNIIVIDEGDIFVINPDAFKNGYAKMKVQLRQPAEFTTMEVRKNSYFMTGLQEFVIAFPDEQRSVHKYYKKPFDKTNFLIGAAQVGIGAASLYQGVSGVTNSMKGAAGATSSVMGMNKLGDGSREMAQAEQNFKNTRYLDTAGECMPPMRKAAFAQTQDFAYYFTKEKDGDEANKILVCVNKDSGDEVDKLIFDDANPMYKVDEIENRVYYGNKSKLKVFQL